MKSGTIVWSSSCSGCSDRLACSCSSVLDPRSLRLHALDDKQNPKRTADPCSEEPAVLPTPDVDQLLECSFSYMKRSEEDGGRPNEEQEEFLSPLAEFKKETVPFVSRLDTFQCRNVKSLDLCSTRVLCVLFNKPHLSSTTKNFVFFIVDFL